MGSRDRGGRVQIFSFFLINTVINNIVLIWYSIPKCFFRELLSELDQLLHEKLKKIRENELCVSDTKIG